MTELEVAVRVALAADISATEIAMLLTRVAGEVTASRKLAGYPCGCCSRNWKAHGTGPCGQCGHARTASMAAAGHLGEQAQDITDRAVHEGRLPG
jgi:hypothetical protein